MIQAARPWEMIALLHFGIAVGKGAPQAPEPHISNYRGGSMQLVRLAALVVFLAVFLMAVPAGAASPKGRLLSGMTWVDAATALNADTVVVIPIGAGSKEHGPHLPLDTDFRQAEYFKRRVMAQADVVIAPTMNYSYYPAFVEYPGATSLSLPVARDLLLDVIRGVAKFGPRRFYVINMGVSTNKPLAEAAALLAIEGISLRYLDLVGSAVDGIVAPIVTQKEGSHADEIETSIMLAIDASAVDMRKATVEYMDGSPRKFALDAKGARANASGVYGDATRATAAKGRVILDGLTRVMLGEIEELRRAELPKRVALFGRLEPPAPPVKEPEPKAPAAQK